MIQLEFTMQYSATVSLKSGGSIQLNLWDTAGQEDYDHIRALAYKDVDCFLVCFSVDSQSSFSNVKQKWIPSIMDSESSDASIILVGTKQDLRNDKKILSSLQAKGSSFVSEEDVCILHFLCVFLHIHTFHTLKHIYTGKGSYFKNPCRCILRVLCTLTGWLKGVHARSSFCINKEKVKDEEEEEEWRMSHSMMVKKNGGIWKTIFFNNSIFSIYI